MSYISGIIAFQILFNNTIISCSIAQFTIIIMFGIIRINLNELYLFYKSTNLPFELELLNKVSNIVINNNNYYILLLILITLIIHCVWSSGTYNNNNIYIEHINNSVSILEHGVFFCSYSYIIFYCIKTNTYYPLYDNILYVIHPVILTCSIVLFFLLTLQKILFRYFKVRHSLKQTILIKKSTFYLLSTSIILGGLWATVSDGWGGFWSWDPSEIILLIVLLVLINELHTSNTSSNISVNYIVVCIYTTVTKLNILPGIHNFINIDNHVIWLITTCSIILGLFLAIITTYSVISTNSYKSYGLVTVIFILFISASCFIFMIEKKSTGLNLFEWSFLLNTTQYIIFFFVITHIFKFKELCFTLILIEICLIYGWNYYFNLFRLVQIIIIVISLSYVNTKYLLELKWVAISHIIPAVSIVVIVATYLIVKEVKVSITDEWQSLFKQLYINIQDSYVLSNLFDTDQTFRKIMYNGNVLFSQITTSVLKNSFSNKYNYSYGHCVTDCVLSYKNSLLILHHNKLNYVESLKIYNKKIILIYIYTMVYLYKSTKDIKYGR